MEKFEQIDVSKCRLLKRNPQYLTPKQMDSLKKSIQRDGFLVPIVVRQLKDKTFEVVSGNHRFLAAQELKLKTIPAVISNLSDKDAKRIAINLNTIHGEPNAELMAPFLAELELETLKEIHIEDNLLSQILSFDEELKKTFESMQPPIGIDRDSKKSSTKTCTCPTCGKKHFPDEKYVYR